MRLPPALKRLPRLHLFCHFLLPFLLFLRPESTESLILRSPLCSVGGRVRILQTKIYFSFTVSYRRTTAARPAPGPALLPPELPRPCRSLASSWRRPTRRRRPKPSIARPWPPDLPLVPRDRRLARPVARPGGGPLLRAPPPAPRSCRWNSRAPAAR